MFSVIQNQNQIRNILFWWFANGNINIKSFFCNFKFSFDIAWVIKKYTVTKSTLQKYKGL